MLWICLGLGAVFAKLSQQIRISSKMAVSTSVSCALSTVLAVLLFSGMQMYRPWLAATQLNTILGGFLGSWLFVFFLTAFSNLEALLMGPAYQTKLPEVAICLMGSMFACGLIHRVCATTCLLFSLVALYYVNQRSQKEQAAPPVVDAFVGKKKRK